ncbi:hypothetical protein EMCRGX_G028528 [Ephydatia muelleri]
MSRARRQVQVGQDKRHGGSCYVTAILVVVAAVAVALYVLRGTDSPSTQAHLAHGIIVPRRPLGNATYREVAELRIPLIITSSVAEKWRARKHFTTAFLSKKLSHVMAYKQETNRVFKTFHDNKALEPLVNEKWEDFNLKVNVTIPQVLAWPSPSPHMGPYLYFSQKLVTLRPMFPDILDYVQPLSDLILNTENIQVNLWIGRRGITTHTHYDATFNFFVQLQGKKRFTLIPPSEPMYLYPCLHPHYGHSQIDIAEPNLDQFAAYRPQPHIAEVGPGDMLVVPPFWFHHVETLEESVSVNVWSNAPEFALINEIYTKALPFEESWGQPDLIRATRVFIDMILASLNITDHSSFLETHLLLQRYQPIVQSGNLLVNRTLVTDIAELCEQTDWIAARTHFQPLFASRVNVIGVLFSAFPGRNAMNICLGNYVEHLISTVAGPQNVFPFLVGCV